MRRFLGALVVLTTTVSCADVAAENPQRTPPSTVAFEGTEAILHVEIADDADEQRQGLMGITELPADQGMAFVYTDPNDGAFWMKDTLIPLSIAFVDEGGRVIDVLDMEPCEADPCPRYGIDRPYVLAIEANLGWFRDHGVDVGDEAELRVDPDG
jgi:uncharacterized protein